MKIKNKKKARLIIAVLLTPFYVSPNGAKVGGLQSQGVRGEAVVAYRDPLTTQDLKSSGFPEG